MVAQGGGSQERGWAESHALVMGGPWLTSGSSGRLWQAEATTNMPQGKAFWMREWHSVCLGDGNCLLGTTLGSWKGCNAPSYLKRLGGWQGIQAESIGKDNYISDEQWICPFFCKLRRSI